MRKMRQCLHLLFVLLCFVYTLPEASLADLWKCGETYTSKKPESAACVKLTSARICGSDGNRYITPAGAGAARVDEDCTVQGQAKSPFVNVEALQALIDEARRIREERDVSTLEQQSPDLFEQQFEPSSGRDDFVLKESAANPREEISQRRDPAELLPPGLQQLLPSEDDMHCMIDKLYNGGDIQSCNGVDKVLELQRKLEFLKNIP